MARRVILVVLAVLVLLAGVASAAGAIWTYLALGTTGLLRVEAGSVTPSPDASATIIDVDRFSIDVPYLEDFGRTELAISPADPTVGELFLGAGPTPLVDGYLTASRYSVALRDGASWTVTDVPGSNPLPAPSEQDLWLVQATGARPAIEVPADRPLTLLISTPAGTSSGPFDITVDFTVPDTEVWIRNLAIAGGVLLLIGALLLFLGLRRRRQRGRHARGTSDDDVAGVAAVAETEPVGTVVAETVAAETVATESAAEETVAPGSASDVTASEETVASETGPEETAHDDAAAAEQAVAETVPAAAADAEAVPAAAADSEAGSAGTSGTETASAEASAREDEPVPSAPGEETMELPVTDEAVTTETESIATEAVSAQDVTEELPAIVVAAPDDSAAPKPDDGGGADGVDSRG